METARTIKAIELQTKKIEGQTVAATRHNAKRTKRPTRRAEEKVSRCFCCGYTGHLYKDGRCPAKSKMCNKCGKESHFAAVCRSKGTTDDGGNKRSTREKAKVRVLDKDGATGGAGYMIGLQAQYSVNAIHNIQGMDKR